MSKERTPVLTRRQVQDLIRYRPTPYLVTTLYLDLDLSAAGGRRGVLRKLIRDARADLDGRDLTRKQRQSADQDLDSLERIARDARSRTGKSVCAFLASGADYEQVIDLPHPVKNRLVLNETPYVRPLEAMLDDYPRYLVVLTDRSRARLVGVHLGRAQEIRDFDSEVPGQVKDGIYRGRGNVERQIERHIDDHVMRHIKKVAETTREAFGERDYDWLILGGTSEAVSALIEALTPTLRSRLAGHVQVDMTAPSEDILAACQVRIGEINVRRETELVDRLSEAMESAGTGVTGLAATLGALRRGAIDTLLLIEDLQEEGVECPACDFLGLQEEVCPACGDGGTATDKVADLVTEIVDRAVEKGAEIRHITTPTPAATLRAMGGIGAVLRFKLV